MIKFENSTATWFLPNSDLRFIKIEHFLIYKEYMFKVKFIEKQMKSNQTIQEYNNINVK